MMSHIPVLLKESIEGLDIKKDGIYVDCTLGRAGHSSEILKRIPEGQLIAFDLDAQAIKEGGERLSSIASNYTLVQSSFMFLAEELDRLGIRQVDGILADLGVSSPQLDDGSRGFSYKMEAPLDMRMNREQGFSAYDVVNSYALNDLVRIIRDYGEDRDAYAIAKRIVEARGEAPIKTTTELACLVKQAKPKKALLLKGHPAKQTFQAIRIEVNQEEEALSKLLQVAPSLLKKGGRLAIITFMSLDDRLVKKRFKELSVIEGSRHGLDLLPSQIEKPAYSLITKKPILPSEKEISDNHRATSAKLRILQKD